MTGLRVEERRIGDAVYRVHQLPFGEARPLLWLGASVITPALEALEGVNVLDLLAGKKSVGDVEVGLDAFGRAFRIFFDRATEADFVRVEELFTARTFVKVDGAKDFVRLGDVKDLHWPSRYGAFASWLRFSAEVHFGPFSRGSAQAGAGLPGPGAP